MTNKILISRRSMQVARVLMSGIFLVSGTFHLLNPHEAVKRIEKVNFKGIAYIFGEPQWLIIAAGIVLFTAGFLFMIGYKTKWAAIALLAVLIPITFTVQVGQMASLGPLFKNIAIAGGLLIFILNDTNHKLK